MQAPENHDAMLSDYLLTAQFPDINPRYTNID
jgi:hypothetical protein